MSDRYTLEHYTNKDNKQKEEVLDLMLKHNSEFAKFDLSLVKHLGVSTAVLAPKHSASHNL